MEDFIEEKEETPDASKEISAKCLSTDQTQLKKLRTNESSQPSKRSRSDHGQKFDVFLSHSGKQKFFVRQLYRDLTNQGLLCFFDEDRESLPVGEDFPRRIFEAVETCRLAVFLLSKEFLQSKWPMLELAACVKARHTNSPPQILPLFFIISPGDLKQITELDEKWKEIGIKEQQCDEWHEALKAIRRINGLKFSEGGEEEEFRDEIVKEIWGKLPAASQRYHVPYMQGEPRMCQEVAEFFNNVKSNEKGIRIAGLHGIAGQGKTTLGKAFCNFKLKDFEGKVCHLEFSRGDSFERAKLALQHLIHCPQSRIQNLIQDQAPAELHKRINGQRVLLVLDNITEENNDEVKDFIKADFGENSCFLLSARSLDVLVKCYQIHTQSCMRVPSLEEDDAIAILVGSTSPDESTLGTEDKALALKCANRCSFKEPSCENDRRGQRFHPLALKAFGKYLLSKYGSNLSKWVAEIDGLAGRHFNGLRDVFNVLNKAFHDVAPKHRTIFMLLTVYLPLNMSPCNVIKWLAISCNEDIEFIELAVEDLCKKAFIEELEPEIRIHDLCFEFAQEKAKEMGRWLCWKGKEHSTRGFISQDNAGFQLAKLEGCKCLRPSDIATKFFQNLLVLQLVDVQNFNKLDLRRMEGLRSITLHDCKVLSALHGMENLLNLAWLQIRGLGKALKLPNLGSFIGLQHLEIDITVSYLLNQLGDLTPCSRLREINVRCPSLLEFPRLKGLPHLEKVKFSMCDAVKGALDCTECVELQSIVLVSCCQMTVSPLLAGCKKLSEIVLSDCGAVMAFPDMDVPSVLKTLQLQISSRTPSAPTSLESCYRLENLRLLDMGELVELPSFRSLSNLTVLEIGKCGIREPPDLTCCAMLEDVHFYTLKNLVRFPNFSVLRQLRKLNLCNCSRVRDPPDISGCHQLQLFYLLYNDNMKGLPKMDKYPQLEEVKMSWQCEDEVRHEGIDPNSFEVDDDLETCLDCFKDVILENLNGVCVPEELEQWMQGRTVLAKKYFRGVKLYYSVTAPYELDKRSKRYSRNPITLKLEDRKVLAYSTVDRVNEDCGWLSRVREYFAGRGTARASEGSGNEVDTSLTLPSSPIYNAKNLKTTLAMAFLHFHLGNFDPKELYLTFCGGASGIQKLALKHLTQFSNLQFFCETMEHRANNFLDRRMEGNRVLLVLDNITENSIDKVRCYVGEKLGEMRCILWTARSVDALNNYKVNFQSFKRLQEEEVIAIMVEERKYVNWPRKTYFALKCADRCSFKGDIGSASKFHQLALKALGRDCSDLSVWFSMLNHYYYKYNYRAPFGDHLNQVFDVLDGALEHFDQYPRLHKYFYHLEKWFAEIDCVDDTFAGLCWLAIMFIKERESPSEADVEDVEGVAKKFKKEIKYIKAKMSSDEAVKWLLINCKKDIKEKVEDIRHKVRGNFIGEDIEDVESIGKKEAGWKVMEDVAFLLRRSPMYHIPSMEGETRMCKEVADFLSTVHPDEKEIRIAGLYGLPGLGKSTLVKVFCNLELGNIAVKVCLLQFCEGNALDRQNLALQYLSEFPTPQLISATNKDDPQHFFKKFMGERVLLVLDNITKDSVDEVTYYLSAEWGENSCILLTARNVDVLNNLNIDSKSCMRVPRLEEEEALAILLERTHVKISALGAKHRGYALKCASICSFKEDRHCAPIFHPLALKVFGRHLFSKHGSNLSKWAAEIDGFANGACDGLDSMFAVLDKAFNYMDPRYRIIFMALARQMPHNVSSDNVLQWVAVNCYEEITYIKEAVEHLCENAFIEEMQPQIRIHNFIKEFIKMKKHIYVEAERGEAKFRDDTVRTIFCLLPQKYHIPAMEGDARMCQKVVGFFNTVHPNEKEISIVGLYGMSGLGKTTLGKAFCNFNFRNFDGKVYHLEFASGGHSMDRQNFKSLTNSLQRERVLLVLDNIQTEESIEVVKYFLQADLGKNSWILLSSRSVDVLKDFIDVQSCMSMPGLEEKEAIAILLERTSLADSVLEAENRGFALQCANKCSFKETTRDHTFHPLALKTLGRHLFSKYGSDLSKWVPVLDGLVVGSGNGLGDMFTVLDKIFEDMDSKYHSIFMLLTAYMPPNMPPHKLTEWLVVNCKEEIDFIEKAVEDLWQKAFIEEIKPEIRILDLYVEFGQSKARKMGRWLFFKRDLITSEAKGSLFSEDEGGFELAKLEHCQHQDLSQIGNRYVENLWALHVARNEMSNLRLSSMKNIRSLILQNCECLEVIQGMENLSYLAWLQIVRVQKLEVLNLSSLTALEYLEINTGGPTELGDLTCCFSLREIYVRCPSLTELPRISGLPCLEKAKFKACEEVNGPLDCRACVKLQSIAFENCWQMAHIPLIDGCSNISKIVLNRCDQVTECSDEDESSASEILKLCISSEDSLGQRHSECCDGLKNIPLWNIVVTTDVPSLRRFSYLTVLKLNNCDIREPPDVACCRLLEDVCFSTLKYLESFPNFSSLWKLKKLCLCNCQRVRAPPEIGGCCKLQVFHLLYNDNMKGFPKIDGVQPLKEIKLSWQLEEVFDYSGSYEDEDIEFCLDYQKDEMFSNINDIIMPVELKEWYWIQRKIVRVKKYFRGQETHYSITAPFESSNGSGAWKQASNADPLQKVIIQRASAISDEDELRFREKAGKAIGRLIAPSIRFPYSSMRKATTLKWLEKASTVKGIHVANLYEVAGNVKTTLCQSFYNFRLNGFEGEDSREFSRGNSLERLNNALQYITCSPGLEAALTTSEILEEDAFSKGPMFNIMILLIRYRIPDTFMDNNLMDIARDFYRNWGGNTRLVFHSQLYTIIELLRA